MKPKFCVSIAVILLSIFIIAAESNAVCLEPPSGLVSWWPGDGNALDIIGDNNGSLNGTTFAPGMVDQAFSFDGVDDEVFSSAEGIKDLQQLTIDAWVMHYSLPANQIQRYVSLDWKAVLRYDFGELHFYMKINNVLHHIWVSDVLQVDSFHHVAGTYDGSTMKLYLDGALVGSKSVSGLVADGNDVSLSSSAEPLDGLLDEVEIYDRALSDAEIKAIYDAGSEGKCKIDAESPYTLGSAQVRHYRYEDGSTTNSVRFVVLDDQGDLINDGAMVTDVELYDPNENLVDLGTISFTPPYEFLGGRFEFDTDQFLYFPSEPDSAFSARILDPLIEGTYKLVVTTVEGKLPTEEIAFNQKIELPFVSYRSFQIHPDPSGNIYWTWAISEELLDLADSTIVAAMVWAYNNDELKFLLWVRLPTYMGFVFIPNDVVQQIPSGASTYYYQIWVYGPNGRNRAMSEKLIVNNPITTVTKKRQVVVIPMF